MSKDKFITSSLSLAAILFPLVVACSTVITPTPQAPSSPEPSAAVTPIISSAPYAPTTHPSTPGISLNLPDIASVVELVRPSVVSVVAEVFLGMDVFGRPVTDFSSGTGVIFDPAGYILTNNHVIEGAIAGAIEVTTDDGDTLPARLIGGDTLVDTRNHFLGDSCCINVFRIKTIAQSRDTCCDLVELNAFFASIWKTLSARWSHVEETLEATSCEVTRIVQGLRRSYLV